MPQFKSFFGPLVLVALWPLVDGWADEQQNRAMATDFVSEQVFIPLSNRNPNQLQSDAFQQSGSSSTWSQPAYNVQKPQSVVAPPVGVTGGSAATANNRFWAPPANFQDGEEPISNGSSWSSTPPSDSVWGGVKRKKPRMASEYDPRFDYSDVDEPLETTDSYIDPDEYRKLRSGRAMGVGSSDLWRDDYSRQPSTRDSVWDDKTPDYRNKPKGYDPFDYSEDDGEMPAGNLSYDSLYNDLGAPPQGTYGNQWR
ncbi:MAG: hypothetical protein HQL70_00405 [Magnetococcales bacterium]|nr:hypothetical protein [Magnetococcales bacterium]